MGKGSRARPFGIDRDEYDRRWNEIFGKNKQNEQHKTTDTVPASHSQPQGDGSTAGSSSGTTTGTDLAG